MNKIRTFILWAKGKYEVLAEKKYTTIAGMLVYFLIMSITPFAVLVDAVIWQIRN